MYVRSLFISVKALELHISSGVLVISKVGQFIHHAYMLATR